jgi:hypothetical protein
MADEGIIVPMSRVIISMKLSALRRAGRVLRASARAVFPSPAAYILSSCPLMFSVLLFISSLLPFCTRAPAHYYISILYIYPKKQRLNIFFEKTLYFFRFALIYTAQTLANT